MNALNKKNAAAFVSTLKDFNDKFDSHIVTLPKNVISLAWSASDQAWFCAPAETISMPTFHDRVPATLDFLTRFLLPRMADGTFWFLFCFYDGWRERVPFSADYAWTVAGDLSQAQEWQGPPGSIPILSLRHQWVGCYGAHRGDPSACLLPEAHYLTQNHYTPLFQRVTDNTLSWAERKSLAIYCGGDHGETQNYFPPFVPDRPHPRRYLKTLAEQFALPLNVRLGESVPLSEQLKYKYILDIDGFARTWDGWAWKMYSGSTVLSVDSPWESFFTRFFEPWTHYVPVANDLTDLGDKLTWCMSHDDLCYRIGQQAQARAKDVYKPEFVARHAARELRRRLTEIDTSLQPP